MGSFWGPNDTTKEAAGWPREWGAWAKGQMPVWLNRSDSMWNQGYPATGNVMNYYQALMQNGLGSPDQIRAWGSTIMPGVDSYISNNASRLQDMYSKWNQIPHAGETLQAFGDAQDQQRAINDISQQQNADVIDSTYGGMANRETAANRNITGDLTDRYGRLIDQTGSTYGNMIDANRSVYGDLNKSAGATYDALAADLEKLNPASEFSQARVARSFAPQMAATQDRLRRAGLDPNSVQGFSAIGRVETARARAQDDAAAEGTRDYVQGRMALGTDRLNQEEKLKLGQLGNEIGLQTDSLGRTTDLSREQGAGLRGETVRDTTAQNAIDETKGTKTLQNLDQAWGRQSDWIDRNTQNALLARGLYQQDWQNEAGINQQLSDAELQALGLKQNEFNAGMGWAQANQNAQNTGASGYGSNAWQSIGQANTASGIGQGWGNTALNAYNQAYQLNAPKAGWGSKMIASMAGPALSMIPGVGPILGSIAGMAAPSAQGSMTMPGGGGGGYGGGSYGSGGYGGYGTPPFLPSGTSGYGRGWQMNGGGSGAAGGASNPFSALQSWMTSKPPSRSYSYYDPNKTAMQPNGTMQVGRY